MSRFMLTKEHRRFTEFANAVRKQKTIGICYGPAGVGKTQSGERYAGWHKARDTIEYWGDDTHHCRAAGAAPINAALARSRTVFFTPQVQTTPKQLKLELDDVFILVSLCIEEHLIAQRAAQTTDKPVVYRVRKPVVELMIIDESERLSAGCIEHLRDRFDRYGIALLLIGMTGLEKQFSHYAQFYSRVGFAHQYRALADDELLFVLQRHWKRFGKTLDPDDFTDHQAVTAIDRITRGNFRLLDRLFTQIDRVLRINDLDTITEDVIEAARSTLVIGTPE
ncbi:MAG: AAA family ATPase [Candidatus Nanopelagicales bacterium]|jgi:hypothetical protein|nr:ATP-binding protein [Actinomycetota bacterium]